MNSEKNCNHERIVFTKHPISNWYECEMCGKRFVVSTPEKSTQQAQMRDKLFPGFDEITNPDYTYIVKHSDLVKLITKLEDLK